jgi:phosphoglycolate phosphatase-like HAD superfamily hydrolase
LIYITDLDGTLCSAEKRLHFIQGQHKNWDAFFSGISEDEPIMPVLTTVRSLQLAEYTIVVITGRPERTRQATLSWLSKHGISPIKMYMRADDDRREDFVVKSELLDEMLEDFPGHKLIGAFEDRDQCVSMFRKRGVTTFQPCEGAY